MKLLYAILLIFINLNSSENVLIYCSQIGAEKEMPELKRYQIILLKCNHIKDDKFYIEHIDEYKELLELFRVSSIQEYSSINGLKEHSFEDSESKNKRIEITLDKLKKEKNINYFIECHPPKFGKIINFLLNKNLKYKKTAINGYSVFDEKEEELYQEKTKNIKFKNNKELENIILTMTKDSKSIDIELDIKKSEEKLEEPKKNLNTINQNNQEQNNQKQSNPQNLKNNKFFSSNLFLKSLIIGIPTISIVSLLYNNRHKKLFNK